MLVLLFDGNSSVTLQSNMIRGAEGRKSEQQEATQQKSACL